MTCTLLCGTVKLNFYETVALFNAINSTKLPQQIAPKKMAVNMSYELRKTTVAPTLVHHAKSDFQDIEIYEHPDYGHQLVIDGDLQISTSDLAYQVSMSAPLIGQLPEQAQVAILGGGDGGVLNQLLQHHDLGHIDLAKAIMIDIDASVIDLCQKHLPVLNDKIATHPRGEIIVGDAFGFLAEQEKCLDAVIYDLTMTPVNANLSQETFTEQTISQIAKSLKPSGVLSMQVCGLQENDPALAKQAALLQQLVPRCCEEYFEQAQTQAVIIPSFEMPWLFQSALYPKH
jgi:spermidine synthase/spermine synthase